MTDKVNIIYGLRDPRNDVYYYIGKSTVGNKRALSHLTKSHSYLVNEWVSNLRYIGLEPAVDIIEYVEETCDLPGREYHWINFYKEINEDLLNIASVNKQINETRTPETDAAFEQWLDVVNNFENLSELIKRERKLRKLTQTDLAHVAGISRRTVCNIESGYDVSIVTLRACLNAIHTFELEEEIA